MARLAIRLFANLYWLLVMSITAPALFKKAFLYGLLKLLRPM